MKGTGKSREKGKVKFTTETQRHRENQRIQRRKIGKKEK
jgi:hypothetical protein